MGKDTEQEVPLQPHWLLRHSQVPATLRRPSSKPQLYAELGDLSLCGSLPFPKGHLEITNTAVFH